MSSIKEKVTETVDKAKQAVSSKKDGQQLILITGASGFVATHITTAFLQAGYHVRATVRSDATAERVKKAHPKFAGTDALTFAIVPDVAAPNAFDNAVKDVTGVVHTASPFVTSVENNQRDLLDPAIKGTTEILNAVQKYAPQVKRIVITSSFAAIIDVSQGNRPGYTYSEKDWNPATYDEAKTANGAYAYCASKVLAEKAALDFTTKPGVNFDVATICPPMIYGPVEHDADLNHLNTSSADIYRFIDGSQSEPGPTQFPAFADVRDVALAHLRAYERKGKGERYLITGGNFQYPDVCEVIRRVVPEVKDKVPDPSETEKVETFKVDNNKATKELGINFRGLEDSIGGAARSLYELQERQK